MKIDNNRLTLKNLTQIFNVTPMTIYNWRCGFDKKKNKPLPCHTEKIRLKHHVYSKWSEVKAWAKENSVTIVSTPTQLNKKNNLQK